MNCTSCGNPIAPDAHFCPRCGTARVFAPPSFTPPLYRDRVARHLQALGVLWLVYACIRATTGVVGLAFLHRFLGGHAFGFFPIWPFAGVSLGIGVIGALLAGYALLTRQPWGRIIAIIFGVFALLHPLFGTAVGIYTLWVLAPHDSGIAYERETMVRRTI
ncbi:MAG TPA: zinc ribbon domain-containing protein [Acidobacteriaceae bacterium]